jgi:hypothetical protein
MGPSNASFLPFCVCTFCDFQTAKWAIILWLRAILALQEIQGSFRHFDRSLIAQIIFRHSLPRFTGSPWRFTDSLKTLPLVVNNESDVR